MTQHDTGSRALILGGSCDLAVALAVAMMAKGLHPVLTYRSDGGKICIDQTIPDATGQYSCLFLDLARMDTFTSLGQELARGMDCLVDFAQGDLEGWVASADGAAIVSYLEANIANRVKVIQQVARSMIARRKGRMLYISSVAAGKPNPGQGFYAASKQACEALYRNVGLELASRGITAVTLRLGYVDAGRGHRYLAQNAGVAMAKVPLGRALEVDEVVDTIMFLLSDSAVGFNGTVLTMDGGLSAGK